MPHDERPKSAGLKWRTRRTGPPVPYWFASRKAIDDGYPVPSSRLSEYANDPAKLIARCQRLQSEMLIWMNSDAASEIKFTGTFGSLIDIYQRDPESTYRNLKTGVQRSYDVYLKKLRTQLDDIEVSATDGRDVKRWFAKWRTGKDGLDHLPRARLTLAVLKAAVSFGIVCRYAGCKDFQDVLREIEFAVVPSRTWAPTAEQIIAARNAAHASGWPRRALVYALQFEATLRQWDIVGQWVPIRDPRPSALIRGGKKWLGPTWSAINDNLLLRIKPTKTEDTSGVEVTFDLSVCPMVVEELASIPDCDRKGPLIVNERTGQPYSAKAFQNGWKADFKAAELPDGTKAIPAGMWNRDLRAGGVTEGGKSGASKDDRRKVAGHAREETTEIYDRDQLEAHRRVMKSRTAYRTKNSA